MSSIRGKKEHDDVDTRSPTLTRADETIRTIDAVVSSGSVLLDESGNVVHVNDAFCAMIGWRREELVGTRAPFIFWPQEQTERLQALMQQAFDQQFPREGAKVVFCRRNGARFPALLLIAPLCQGNGTNGWVANIIELSAQLAQADALRGAEEQRSADDEAKLRAILDRTPVAIYASSGLDQSAHYVNRTFIDFFGYTLAEVPTISDWWPKAYPDPTYREQISAEWQTRVERALQTGSGIEPMETIVTCKDGSHRNILWGYVSTANENWAFGLDRTERREAELVLRESIERFQRVFDHALTGIAVTDMQGRFEQCNPAYAALLGYTEEELRQREFITLVHPQDQAENRVMFHRLVAEEIAAFEINNRYVHKDGHPIWVHKFISCLPDRSGRPAHMMTLVTDVSEQRALQEALRQEALAANAANVAKSAFLANMSHEIRTPLNAITGMAYLLQHSELSPQQTARLDKIIDASRHLLEIINAVLELSKIEAGKFELAQSEVDLRKIADEVVAMIFEQARAKKLKLTAEAPRLPTGLRGDPVRIRQALLNLANNAVKFTDTGSVAIRYRVEAADTDRVQIRFEVDDTGIGIDAQALPRLFSAFEQADPSLTRKYGGTGLGLTITKRLAELMGGEAGGDSRPGEGSRFWFTIQLTQTGSTQGGLSPTPAQEIARDALRRRHAGKRILLAEDEPNSVALVEELAALAGLVLETAADGLAAVERARERRYDLILMDVQMPRLNGLDAARQIRQWPANAAVPIIALTANVYAEDKARVVAAGMNDFVSKPMAPDQLFEKLLRWLDRKDL